MTEIVSELELGFPHIATSLVEQWGKPEVLRYLDTLLVDTRGGRKGFPFSVLQDIMLLREIHIDKHHSAPTPGSTYSWHFTA